MRQRIPLQFGAGLDRSSGFLAGSPERMVDVRNVYPRNGKLEVRKGMTEQEAFAGVDAIVGGGALRPEQIGIVVGYEAATRALKAFRTDGLSQNNELLGTWFTAHASAHTPPRVFLAENYDRVFMAHDELRFGYRGQTHYYDPGDPLVLVPLSADLDGNGDAPVKFRGVVTHLEYLFGWGFGSASEDRPEMVRPSLPGQPTRFERKHYAVVGSRGDPVLACLPQGNILLCLKGSEAFAHTGYSRDTFGVEPVDLRYGLASPHLAVAVFGAVFAWTLEGPRVFQGGPSEDLGYPLDLSAPSPADLVAEGAVENAFAQYIPERRSIEFTFGPRVYTLHLWNRAAPEWTYQERGVDALCGFMLYSGGTAKSAAPTGAPSFDSATTTHESADLTVDHTNAAGDEWIETWIRETAGPGAWSMVDSRRVNALAQQEVHLDVGDVPTAGAEYDLALRYRRGAFYTAGYEDATDPSLWPSYVASAFTTLLRPPTIDSFEWERTGGAAERIRITITPEHNEDVVITRGGGIIHTEAAASHGGAPFTYDDTGFAPEAANTYGAYHDSAATESPTTEETTWGGPTPAPSNLVAAADAGFNFIEWTGTGNGRETELWAKNVTAGTAESLLDTKAADATTHVHGGLTAGDQWRYRVKEKENAHATDDFTDWSNSDSATAI